MVKNNTNVKCISIWNIQKSLLTTLSKHPLTLVLYFPCLCCHSFLW